VPEKASLRTATREDLEDINAVIEAAVMNWNLPERIKRLALPTYRYSPIDYEHLEIIVAEIVGKGIVGVAACEIADADEVPGQTALLLHGLYVRPEVQHQGIGSQLLRAIEALVPGHRCDGLLVKAQTDAVEFFEYHGMQRLESINPASNYAHRFWKPVSMM
jgi:GNAT superfamily N-acetyltransferase